MIDRTTILRVSPHVAHAEVDGETTVLDPRSGQYVGLEDVGARIWAALSAPASIEAVIVALRAEYDVDDAECAADVLAFVDELLARGLVEVLPG